MNGPYNQWHKPDDLLVADREQELYGISAYVRKAWAAHRSSARKRGIDFRFTLFQWDQWWKRELLKLGPDARRGNRRGEYMMARFGDLGAYKHDNVYAATAAQNMADIPADVRAMATAKAGATARARGKPRGGHLKVRGDGHPKSMPVITENGTRYGSIALACDATPGRMPGTTLTRAGGSMRIKRGLWRLAYEPEIKEYL